VSVAKSIPSSSGPAAGEKIVLDRDHRAFMRTIEKHWAASHQVRWKQLAMLYLQEQCGWNSQEIGRAFGQNRGRAYRLIKSAKRQLAEKFTSAQEPDSDLDATEEMPFGVD
jgi:DNA-directed RNA polymerase specialized sigma24 family protein